MLDADKYSVETKIKVPFHDVDPAQVVWHGHYVKYLEIARCDLLDKIGYSYREMEKSGYFWPIVDLRIKYVRPLLFEQLVIVKATIKEWEYRLKIEYVIFEAETMEKVTKAHTIQVAFDIAKKEMQYESPPILKKMLGVD